MNKELEIYQALASIGINISSDGDLYPFTDIEKTIILASNLIGENLRIFNLLINWIHIHGHLIHVERLEKLRTKDDIWISCLALYARHIKLQNWERLIIKPDKKMYNGDSNTLQMQADFKGEEKWAKGSGFIVPIGTIYVSEKNIIFPEVLARVNYHYRNKLLYGNNWRADIITAYEAGCKNANQARKITGSSYAPAYRVYNDLQILRFKTNC